MQKIRNFESIKDKKKRHKNKWNFIHKLTKGKYDIAFFKKNKYAQRLFRLDLRLFMVLNHKDHRCRRTTIYDDLKNAYA